jgi:hypothetical protein
MEKERDTGSVWDEKEDILPCGNMLSNYCLVLATDMCLIKTAFVIHDILPHFNSAMSVTYQNGPVFQCRNDASDIQSIHDYRQVFRKYVHLAHTQYISGNTSNANSTRPLKRNVHFHKLALHRWLHAYVFSSQTRCYLSTIMDSLFPPFKPANRAAQTAIFENARLRRGEEWRRREL